MEEPEVDVLTGRSRWLAVPIWLLSLGPREVVSDEPHIVLKRSFQLTAKCRYNASIRLARLARFSFLTGTLLALGLIFIPLLQLTDLRLAYPTTILNALQIFLAVAALVYSVINATAHYETRASALNECGDGIKILMRELRTAIAAGHGAVPHDQLQSFNTRYTDITSMSENHHRCDYWLALLQTHPTYRVTGVPRAWMYFITYLAQLTPYIAPAMLIVFETVMVLDALGVSHVLTPIFVAAAASRIAP
jgi:hypothetical protein